MNNGHSPDACADFTAGLLSLNIFEYIRRSICRRGLRRVVNTQSRDILLIANFAKKNYIESSF